MEKRRLEIQWLRAIAACEVAFWHSDLMTKHFSAGAIQEADAYAPFGGMGVELFFIVSGYIICMRAPTYSGGAGFLISRILRLYPLYWIFTLLVLVAFIVNPAWRLGNFELDAATLLKSYLIWPQWEYPMLGVGWTLEHEMVFYAMVALFMVVAPRMLERESLLFAFAVAGLGALGLALGTAGSRAVWDFHLVSPYLLLFAFGWMMRLAEDSSAAEGRKALWFACFVALLLAGAFAARQPEAILVPRFVVAAAVFVGFLHFKDFFAFDNAFNRWMSRVGDASYSIYLAHWFVLSACGKVLGKFGPPEFMSGPARLVGCYLSIVVGLAVFYYIEKPLDRLLRKRREGAMPLADVAAVGSRTRP